MEFLGFQVVDEVGIVGCVVYCVSWVEDMVIEVKIVPTIIQAEGMKALELLLVNFPISLDDSMIFSGYSCEELKIVALTFGVGVGVGVGVIVYAREI